MFPRAARVFVAVSASCLGVRVLLAVPPGLRAVASGATSLGMVVAVVVGVRMWRPSRPLAGLGI